MGLDVEHLLVLVRSQQFAAEAPTAAIEENLFRLLGAKAHPPSCAPQSNFAHAYTMNGPGCALSTVWAQILEGPYDFPSEHSGGLAFQPLCLVPSTLLRTSTSPSRTLRPALHGSSQPSPRLIRSSFGPLNNMVTPLRDRGLR